MKLKKIPIFILIICLCFLPIKVFAASPEATLYIDGVFSATYPSVGDAVAAYNAAPPGTDFVIEVAAGTVSDAVGIIQQPNKNLVLRPQPGATVTFTNTITIDGNGNLNNPETLLIEGFIFDFSDPATPAECINIGKVTVNANHTYAHNVTINGCTFIGRYDQVVALQSISAPYSGMKNISIMNSTATDMHSLAQLKAASGYVFIQNCTLTNTSEGVNIFGTADLFVDSCNFEVTGYAVRSGQTGSPIVADGSININNSVLTSSSVDRGTVVLRSGPSNINIIHSNLTNTAGGPVIENTNAAQDQYVIDIVETNLDGGIVDIDPATIRIIDAPNVENGPISVTIINGSSVLVTILIVINIVLIVLLFFFAAALYNALRRRNT